LTKRERREILLGVRAESGEIPILSMGWIYWEKAGMNNFEI
jgi:hypothetical protein